MATKNEELVTETASALLNAIKTSAQETTGAAYLRDLAEAFSLVASSDPKNPPAAPRQGRFGLNVT